ncbi:hypothetical protein BDF22DRAFT_778060 [Syncephalis plumigaleata]|nr:hypothetical protein BDF22DRAFT_778060 [Syncephalis plumigaleata]
MAVRASLSRLFVPTSKDVSATAKAASHQLLLRAGFIRQSASGIYTLLPFAVRSIAKLERLVDEEMEAIGACKLSLPMLLSADHWRKTGRWDTMQQELFRLKDRKESDFCLAPTHEEEITRLVADEISSYRQLPLRLYQIGRKYRDELRPRSGLLRGREFIMKDLYTFDVNVEAAERTYFDVVEAYKRIFTRLSIPFAIAKADTGNIGGSLSHEFHICSQVGEDTLLSCSECDYTANEELAKDAHLHYTLKELPLGQTISYKPEHKQLFIEMITNGKMIVLQCRNTKELFVACLSRGRTLNLNKITKQLDTAQELTEVSIKELTDTAQISRVHFIFDNVLAIEYANNVVEDPSERALSTNQTIILNALEQSDFIRIADIHNTRPGDPCYECHAADRPKATLKAKRAIEVGHTFLLGDKYSKPLEATFQASNVSDQKYPMQMGCYGLGITRILAAVAEATHDKYGLRWPWSLAPYRVCIIPLQQITNNEKEMQNGQLMHEARQLQEQLETQISGLNGDVVLDDRYGLSAGWRLKDADLIGYPWLVVLGKTWANEKRVELQHRFTKERWLLSTDELLLRFQNIAQNEVGYRHIC